MDVRSKEKLDGEKKFEDSVNYPTPDCRFGGGNYVSSSMADSYSSLNQTGLPVLGPWQEPNLIPADSAFIERAARFSCFNSGNVTDLMNSFPMNHEPVSSYHQLSSIPYGPQKNKTNSPSTSKGESKQTESDEAESVSLMDTDTEPKGVGNKKGRRRAGPQDKQSSPTIENSGKAALEPQKEEYIHVRARRGQATNSHSLAERIRREKISERMKYLQDLVPGCSKVTGKAVMLDEIINYVQSLQRQVEFLSMKLATVNPKVDFNIDSLLAKEQLFPTLDGPSSSMGFSPDVPMVYPSMHPHFTSSMNQGYKESTQQMSNVWDYDLQNIVQMGFDHSNPVENQEPSRLAPTQTKAEP